MTTNTAKWVIPQLTTADTLAATPTAMTNLANRVDLLLGEGGQFTASPAAGTTLTQAIVLSRTYPGNNAPVAPAIAGSVWVWCAATIASTTSFNWWITAWTGSATTITGFSISMQWSAAQVSRGFFWRFLPVL